MKKIRILFTLLLLAAIGAAHAEGISVSDVSLTPGSQAEIVINCEFSNNDIMAYQFDLYLPEGVTLAKNAKGRYAAGSTYVLSDRHDEHTASLKDNNGFVRFVISNNYKYTLTPGSGELLKLIVDVASSVSGELQASVKNFIMSETNETKHYMNDVTFKMTAPSTTVLATSVTLNQTTATLTSAGETVQLTATVLPENANNKSVTWSSNNTSVATVSKTGLVTAVANGTATITATTNDGSGKSATCEVTVDTPILLTGISLSSSSSDEISQAINLKEKNFGFSVLDAGLTGKASFSLCYWLKVNNVSSGTQFFAVADKAGSWPLTDWGWNWSTLDKAGALVFTYRNSLAAEYPAASQYIYPAGTMPIGVWTHVAIVFDRKSDGTARHKLYINGKFITPTVNYYATSGGTAQESVEDTYYPLIDMNNTVGNNPWMCIGGPASGRGGIDGIVDNFQLWKKAISEEEVQVSMGALDPSNLPAGLSCFWNFENKADDGKGFVAVGATPGLEAGSYELLKLEGEGRAQPHYVDQVYTAILTTLTSVGQTATLIAMVTPDDATNKSVTWTSSDESVATVSETGIVTAVANGTATITATANDGSGKSATCEVTVNIPTSPDQPDIEGKTFKLNSPRGYIGYSSSRLYLCKTNVENASKFAIVSYEGKNYLYDVTNAAFVVHSTAAKAGTTGNILRESKTDFSKAVTGFVWGKTDIETYPWYLEDDFGNWLQMDSNPTPIACMNTWKDFEGGTGGNTYNVTIVDTDFEATAAIQMLNNYFHPVLATGVTLNQTTATLTSASETLQLIATVLPENASNKSVTWSSNDESVATVSETGLVTAVANGTATITATANDGSGKSATCEVTVTLTTGIGSVLYNATDVWYTIDGRRIQSKPTQSGIYIVNGRKVYVK